MSWYGYTFESAETYVWNARLDLSRARDYVMSAIAHPWDDSAADSFTNLRGELLIRGVTLDADLTQAHAAVSACAREEQWGLLLKGLI